MRFPVVDYDHDRRYQQRQDATEFVTTRGTAKKPQPPRDLYPQSGSRKILLTWKLPLYYRDITGWRVYKDDETSLFQEIRDRGTRQAVIDCTAGATPPVVNLFVSSVNAQGVESAKVQTQGSATAESGAPTDPSPPPGFTSEASGGGNRSTGGIRYSGGNPN